MSAAEHERLICMLLAPFRRTRYREQLTKGSAKLRDKFLDELHHTLDFDDRFAHRVPSIGLKERPWILNELRRRGAPETCYVISRVGDLDGRMVPLEQALDSVHGALTGSLLSCIPGRLAYYQGEDLGERYILHREAHG